MSITFKNATKNITLGQAVELHREGISIMVSNGKDVTFEIEKEPIRRQAKQVQKKNIYLINYIMKGEI